MDESEGGPSGGLLSLSGWMGPFPQPLEREEGKGGEEE